MTFARRVDENQAEIVRALEKIGAFVQPLYRVGQGCPDLAVAWRQRWFFFEVKRDAKAKTTHDQKRWYAKLGGQAPVFIVTSAIEAINFMQRVQP